MHGELLAGETIEIADEIKRLPQHVQGARLRIDTRKWLASKYLPRVYGEHVAVDVSGELSLRALVAESYTLQGVEPDQAQLEDRTQDASDVGD